MPLLDNIFSTDVIYILNNTDIWFKDEKNNRFKNLGLENFIRIYKFIPDGIKLVKNRRKTMVAKSKTVKKAVKKPTSKLPKKASVKKPTIKKPAKKK
jgi:hypothetical protein